MQINEPVEVETLPSGMPIRFTWRGQLYGVLSTPEPWITRRRWWNENTRVAPGNVVTLDMPVWRVEAVTMTGDTFSEGIYDVARGPGGATWMLLSASSEELDHLLFA
ncbi:MAG: DUF6504 family protein [Actinobacteria bacterium]|nr:DUF6504 family protein [Actinomycetota bacterium]